MATVAKLASRANAAVMAVVVVLNAYMTLGVATRDSAAMALAGKSSERGSLKSIRPVLARTRFVSSEAS